MKGLNKVAAPCFLALMGFCIVYPAHVALADPYELLMSQDDELCKATEKFFSDYLNRLREEQHQLRAITWQPRIAVELMQAKHQRFSNVDWTTVEELSADLKEKEEEITQARVDIDNDGQLDLVIKVQWRLGGVTSDALAIFKGKGKPEDAIGEFSLALLNQADSVLDFMVTGYELKRIPKLREGDHEAYHTTGAFELTVFQFDGETYISVTNPYASKGKDWSEWRVIGKYTAPATIEDICYLKRLTRKTSKQGKARKER